MGGDRLQLERVDFVASTEMECPKVSERGMCLYSKQPQKKTYDNANLSLGVPPDYRGLCALQVNRSYFNGA